MPPSTGPVLFAAVGPLGMTAAWWLACYKLTGQRVRLRAVCIQWGAYGVMLVVLNLIAGFPVASAAGAGNTVLAVLWWWWRRKQRRRALAGASEKYRHLLVRMLRVLRQAAKPRPVRRLAPQAATFRLTSCVGDV